MAFSNDTTETHLYHLYVELAWMMMGLGICFVELDAGLLPIAYGLWAPIFSDIFWPRNGWLGIFLL